MRFGICATSSDNPPPPETWSALRSLNFEHLRLTVSLPRVFPKPGVIDWSSVRRYVEPAAAAGLRIYMNASWCPAWASGGQPAYVGLIEYNPETRAHEGTAWWNEPGFNPDPALRNDIHHGRPNAAAGIHLFGDQPANDFPDPPVAYLPPRPYLANPPARNHAFLRDVGYHLALELGSFADSFGFENEPGDPFFNPTIRGDGVNGGPLGDTVKERFIFEAQAFADGVRSVLPDATIMGCEAESNGILDRCLEAESALGAHIYDVLSFHPYQDDRGPFPERSYERLEKEFMPVARKWRNGRGLQITEIGAQPDLLLAWTEKVTATYGTEIEAIYYLTRGTFLNADDRTPSPVGEQFKALFAGLLSG
jgi:hypothetical protein